MHPAYEAFVTDANNSPFERGVSKNSPPERGQKGVSKYKFFEDTLKAVKSPEHPNLQYFIYKNIILKNIYGVDIMHEAVEIAKLRLFLKLVATVDVDYKKPNLGLEPLPDIDFNIRAGNTLVGFAMLEEVEKVFKLTFYKEEIEAIKEQAEMIKMAYENFKNSQVVIDSPAMSSAKRDLEERSESLNEKLNIYLAQLYGVAVERKPKDFEKWKVTHQPFHWFAEFYEIIHDKGGFDVIIGNPPYIVYSEKSFKYKMVSYETEECKDLYAFVIERSTSIINQNGAIGMIVPVSIVSTDGFNSLRVLLQKAMSNIWYSSYAMRPGKLFEGVEKHLTIFISNRNNKGCIYTTKYYRWYTEERETLFSKQNYTIIDKSIIHNTSIPKIGTESEASILRKLKSNNSICLCTINFSKYVVFHTRKLRYFLQFLDTPPKIYEEDGQLRVTSELKKIYFKVEEDKLTALSAYLSTLFFWYYVTYSDCRNLNKREVSTFPFSMSELDRNLKMTLVKEGKKLMDNLQENSYFLEAYYKQYSNLKMQVFQPRLSKVLVDKIDMELARHYGFTDEELDFIINYDIKYRMGRDYDDNT